MGKSAKNTASTTKDNIKTQYREKNNREIQHRKIAENENRAYNNQTDIGRTEKQFLFSPFLPSEPRKDTRIGKYTQRKRKPLRGKENGRVGAFMG